MNVKPHGESILYGLTPELRAKVDGWLFDENNSCRKAAKRCREELGVEVGKSSVQRYYERECACRSLQRIASVTSQKREVLSALAESPEEDYQLVVGMAGQLAAAEALRPVGDADVDRIGKVTKLMIAARREGHEHQRSLLLRRRVALAEKRFQFDAAIECLRHEQAMKAIMDNDELNDPAKVMAIRERLFGPDLPS